MHKITPAMRRIIYPLVWILLVSCHKSDQFDLYGAAVNEENAFRLEETLKGLHPADSTEVNLVAQIDKVCQVKGCWMTLKTDSGQSVRVTFKDYGFFVPKDASGKKVIISGGAFVKQLDEATAKHYAADAGEEYKEADDPREVSIVASGVLIEKSR